MWQTLPLRLASNPGQCPLGMRAFPTHAPYLFGMVKNSEPSHKCHSKKCAVQPVGSRALTRARPGRTWCRKTTPITEGLRSTDFQWARTKQGNP